MGLYILDRNFDLADKELERTAETTRALTLMNEELRMQKTFIQFKLILRPIFKTAKKLNEFFQIIHVY